MPKEEFANPKKVGTCLRFTPRTWAKILYMRDKGDSEIGGFGITATEDPLLVTDFVLVPQECTGATVDIEGRDVNDHMNKMMDAGLAPWQCVNIWIHTHPGNCPNPSQTDEDNFKENFGASHWAVFFILAKDGEEYAQLRFNVGPGCNVQLPTAIDHTVEFGGTDYEAWDKEYQENVKIRKFIITHNNTKCVGIPKQPRNNIHTLDKFRSYNLWNNEEDTRGEELMEMLEEMRDNEEKTEELSDEEAEKLLDLIPSHLEVDWLDQDLVVSILDTDTSKEYEYDVQEDRLDEYLYSTKRNGKYNLVKCKEIPEWLDDVKEWIDAQCEFNTADMED